MNFLKIFGRKKKDDNHGKDDFVNSGGTGSFYIISVEDPNSGEKHKYISIMPLAKIKEKGLYPEAIVGEYFGAESGELDFTVRSCKGNTVFKDFMQKTFVTHARFLPLNIEEAKRSGVNMIVLSDLRNGNSGVGIAEDVYGVMAVEGDVIGEYTPNPNYLLFSEKGPMTLPQDLREVLLKELIDLYDRREKL